MGYSTPKKQFDLKEFLSEPAKRLPPKNRFQFRAKAAATAAPVATKSAGKSGPGTA